MATGRGRLSSFDLLPDEAAGIVRDAARELSARERTQTEIYADFVTACERLMAEHRGELEFGIPAFSSFNRFSMRKAALARHLAQTNDIVKVLSEKWDAKASDDLTVITAEAIKALVLHMVGEATDGMAPLEVMQLASGFKAAAQAQNLSTDRTIKLQKNFDKRMVETIDSVAKTKGLTADIVEELKAKVLGVEK